MGNGPVLKQFRPRHRRAIFCAILERNSYSFNQFRPTGYRAIFGPKKIILIKCLTDLNARNICFLKTMNQIEVQKHFFSINGLLKSL